MSAVTTGCVCGTHIWHAGNLPIKLWQAGKGQERGHGAPHTSPGTGLSPGDVQRLAHLQTLTVFRSEGTLTGHLAQLPARSSDVSNPIKLLRALSNLTWNVSRDGPSTGSPSNLFRCFTTLAVKHSSPHGLQPPQFQFGPVPPSRGGRALRALRGCSLPAAPPRGRARLPLRPLPGRPPPPRGQWGRRTRSSLSPASPAAAGRPSC